jgi:hypothetical protein
MGSTSHASKSKAAKCPGWEGLWVARDKTRVWCGAIIAMQHQHQNTQALRGHERRPIRDAQLRVFCLACGTVVVQDLDRIYILFLCLPPSLLQDPGLSKHERHVQSTRYLGWVVCIWCLSRTWNPWGRTGSLTGAAAACKLYQMYLLDPRTGTALDARTPDRHHRYRTCS